MEPRLQAQRLVRKSGVEHRLARPRKSTPASLSCRARGSWPAFVPPRLNLFKRDLEPPFLGPLTNTLHGSASFVWAVVSVGRDEPSDFLAVARDHDLLTPLS